MGHLSHASQTTEPTVTAVKHPKIGNMEEKVINILLVEDDEVDVMNVKRAFKKY